MNHGDLAYISAESLRLSSDLLRPLSILNRSELTCFFTPLADQKLPDFFLTPIPYRSWPYVAGMRIDLPQRQGVLADLTEMLKDRKINILIAQCARGGYNGGTCNFVLEFEALVPRKKDQDRDPGLSSRQLDHITRKELPHAVARLEADLEKSGLLPSHADEDVPDCYFRKPLTIWPIRPLAHYYRHCQETKRKTFQIQCAEEGLLSLEGARYLAGWEDFQTELPTLGFASMDTDDFGLHITVIPQSDLPDYRSIRITYSQPRREENEETVASTRGLIHSITHQFRENWDLWKLYDLTERNTPSREEGAVELIMERKRHHPLPQDLDQEARDLVIQNFPRDLGIKLEPVQVNPVSNRRIFVSLRSAGKFERRRDVLRLCQEMAPTIGILPGNVITVESYTASSVTAEVSETIESCSGMLQFYLGEGASMDWLNAEFFLACYLKIPTVRFVSPALEGSLLFQRDRPAKLLPENSSDLVFKEAIKEALLELDREMRARA